MSHHRELLAWFFTLLPHSMTQLMVDIVLDSAITTQEGSTLAQGRGGGGGGEEGEGEGGGGGNA